jgi:nitrite reductase (NAD(P)H)
MIEYFQHRNIEDLYLNDVGWYAKQNPEHFAFHIGEQVRSAKQPLCTKLTCRF